MMRFQTKKNKSTQYVIGGTVAVIILGLWISLPLMSGSSLDSSVSTGNPFRSKVADISLLGSDISSEGGAPGSPLSGDMINNPATSGEEIASSLFESGPGSDEPAVAVSADASAAPAASPMASAGAPAAPSGPRGRLSAAASITAGNSSSMSSGGKHDKFFGTGNQKSEFAPAAPADLKKMAATDKKNSPLLAMLGNTADKSVLAAKTGSSMDAAKGGSASAFANTAKASGSDLNNGFENLTAQAGLQMGQTAQDLKKNDPSLNKSKIVPPATPEKVEDKDDEMKQQLKMMIIQMVLKMALGAVLGVPV